MCIVNNIDEKKLAEMVAGPKNMSDSVAADAAGSYIYGGLL